MVGRMHEENMRTLSPCAEESEAVHTDTSDDTEVRTRAEGSWKERCLESVWMWWTRFAKRVRYQPRAFARDSLECVGATLLLVWIVLRWHRQSQADVPDFLLR